MDTGALGDQAQLPLVNGEQMPAGYELNNGDLVSFERGACTHDGELVAPNAPNPNPNPSPSPHQVVGRRAARVLAAWWGFWSWLEAVRLICYPNPRPHPTPALSSPSARPQHLQHFARSPRATRA